MTTPSNMGVDLTVSRGARLAQGPSRAPRGPQVTPGVEMETVTREVRNGTQAR